MSENMLRLAVAAVLEADREFRSNMPPEWDGDPLSSELDGLRRIFEATPAPVPNVVVDAKPIALISEATLNALMQDTGGTFRVSAPKWPSETETVPLYLAPTPAELSVAVPEVAGEAEHAKPPCHQAEPLSDEPPLTMSTAAGVSLASPAAPAELSVGYQERVAAAHHALFHDDPTDVAERVARFLEEAMETAQAFGMTLDDVRMQADYTFNRPAGEPEKEIGAALLTLTSLCVVAGHDVMACGEADLEKLQRPETIARIRAKRSTRHGRGPLPGFDPAALSASEVEG